MNSSSDQQLLRDYVQSRSESAFAELVRRHVDLVYSAALRMVCDPHLAEDVTQSAFVALAQNAGQLAERQVFSGWLHRTAQNIAAQTVRTEVRRRAREHEAAAMNDMLSGESDAVWEQIAPHLDGALVEISEPDRDALMLRYFERKSAREMAQILGVSEEAAQKRVSRAIERLRELLLKRGVTVGTGALVIVLSAEAVQAAPGGLAVTISATANLAGAAVSTSTAITVTKTIVMTTLQKTLIAASLVATVSASLYEARQASELRGQVQALRQQQAPLAAQIKQLQSDRDQATNRVALLSDELAKAEKKPSEVLRLRGEVGRLRQENANITSTSALSKITADPATKKLIRDQQKMGMGMIYKDFASNLKLTKDQTEQFNDMMADHIMDDIDHITQVLHDKNSKDEINAVFAGRDSAMLEKVQAMLGPEGLAQFQDYNKNLLSTLSASQFEPSLTGDADQKAQKKQQFMQAMQQATQSALTAAGLPSDFQAVPILNFRNIASEEMANQDVQLLDGIYAQVATKAAAFLSPEELTSFQEFRTKAVNNSTAALAMNRTLMAPLSN